VNALRKPRAKKEKTLVEMVLDLDLRMEGDEAADVLLPPEEWTALRVQAEAEKPSWSDLHPEKREEAAREAAAFLSVLRWELVYAKTHGEFRRAAAWLEKLDALKEDRITKSVTTQGECERIWRELGMEDITADAAAESVTPPRKRKTKTEKVCPHCDETGHAPDDCGLKPATQEEISEAEFEEAADAHPADCSMCDSHPYLLRFNGKLLAGHYEERQAAVDYGKSLNRGNFEVVDVSGKVWDLVGVAPPSPKRKKKAEPKQEEVPF
jgi:hypothetical protein